MSKTGLQFNLPVLFLREKKRFVAYSPALDLSTSGKSLKEAKQRFAEASSLFFEEIIRNGTLEEVLSELGWQKVKKEWRSPVVVSQGSEAVRVAAA